MTIRNASVVCSAQQRCVVLFWSALIFGLGLLGAAAGSFVRQTDLGANVGSRTREELERGRELMQQHKFSEAAAEFREILKTEPGSPFLYNLLGFCALQQGLQDQAVSYFEKARQLNPDFKPARHNLGGIYLLQGKLAEAREEFLAITRIDPRDAQAYFNLARSELAAKQRIAGIKDLQRAHELAPDDAPISLALSRLYLEEGDQRLGQPIIGRLARASATNGASELELASILLAYGKESAALERFRRAVAADPGTASSLYAVAVDRFRKQDYRIALELLELVGRSMQNSAAWHEFAGESQFKLGDSASAVAELQKAMQLDPRNETYVLELSEVFVSNNNADAAVTLLQSASRIFARSARIWFGLGVAYLEESHYAAAEAALNRTRELDPTLDLPYVVLCRAYYDQGQWNQLTETAKRLVRVNANNPMGYYYQALAGLHNTPGEGRPDAEIEMLLHKCIELDGDDPAFRYELAKLKLEHRKKSAAFLELKSIVRTSPEFSAAHYQLSRLYRERGDIKQSEEEQRIFQRLSAQERIKASTKMLVEIHERPPGR